MALDAARLADADFGGLVDAVRAAAATAAAPAAGRFAHVDREALQRIVDARLAGAEAPQAARSLLAEAARGGIGGEKRGVPSPHAPTLDYCCNVEARAAPC